MLLFRRIWAVYGILVFLSTMAVVAVPVLLFNMAFAPGEKALRRNIWFLHHVYTPIFLTMIGVRMKTSGTAHLRKSQSYVIVANHSSSIDFVIHAHAFPGVFRFLAKQELTRMPIFGWVVKKMCLTVDRKSAMSRARSVVNLKKELAAGWSILIYPEGGRNRTEKALAPFYDGAFRIAIQTGAPIAVQTTRNINAVSRTASAVDLSPGTVHIVWEEVIHTAGLTPDDIPSLKAKVEALMMAQLNP